MNKNQTIWVRYRNKWLIEWWIKVKLDGVNKLKVDFFNLNKTKESLWFLVLCVTCQSLVSYNSLYNRISQPRENLRWPMNFKWTTCARKPSRDWCKLQLFPLLFSSQSLILCTLLPAFPQCAIWHSFSRRVHFTFIKSIWVIKICKSVRGKKDPEQYITYIQLRA